MIDVTWVIGNGFDTNLNLGTGYRDFLDNVYLRGSEGDPLRDELISSVGEDPRLRKNTHWSDLEGLLAYASQFYSGRPEAFHETFESMQRGFISYVHEREERLPKVLSAEALNEFWESVRTPYRRMVSADRSRFLLKPSTSDTLRYRFISLNYTHALDRFITEARGVPGYLDARRVGNTTCPDQFEDVFHLHGTIDGGHGRGIIFGVSSPDQFASAELAESSDFCDMWVKSSKNLSIYGNDKTEQMKSIIRGSRVICIYGCSLGKSDDYIWHEIGNVLKSQPKANVVYFVHNLPDRLGQQSWKYRRMRNKAIANLATALGLTAEEMSNVRNQVLILASDDVFRFDGLVEVE